MRLGKDLGVKINYVSTEAANRVEYLETGKVDVILANFTVTDERAEKVDFALPYMNVALGVVSHEDNVIKSLDEIGADDQVIVISGTTAETYLEKNKPDIKLQKFDTYAAAKTAFENGTGVAWANDNTEVIAYAKENEGYVVGISSLGDQQSIAPAVTKGNSTLLNWINDEIKSLGKENFFHADYEATLLDTYGADYEDTLVIEGGGDAADKTDTEATTEEGKLDITPGNGETIKVAASPIPHAEILAKAADILKDYGYDLEVTEFDDYVQPNLVVESGEFDANYVEHLPYLNSFNEEQGTHLVDAGDIHYEPFGIYPGTKSKLEDIAENPHNLQFVELEAAQVARVVNEVEFVVLNGNLSIEQGDIFGIIGMSGAGKSTLVRSINYLEKPTEGQVLIDGVDLADLTEKQLRKKRSDIGMIFQNFNLLEQKNVLDNICFPLEIVGVKKKEARKRAEELLKTVNLEEKAKAYPSQLSGGQKQRVAIARALATNPKILLCDEATSALDPQTTAAILKLLKEINETLGITIIIITHQMSVVTEICKRVAIIDSGNLVEEGLVEKIFENPQSDAAKELISGKAIRYTPVENLDVERKIRIVFQENSAFEPVISNIILQYQVPVNILKADTKNVSGKAVGEMILGLPTGKETQDEIIAHLRERGLVVTEVTENV